MRDSERSALARLRGFGGDALVRTLTALYVEQTDERLASTRCALDRGDLDAVARAAHGLRSAAAQLGATDVVAACELLEDAADRDDLRATAERFARLEAEAGTFRAWLVEQDTGDRGNDAHTAATTGELAGVRPVIAVVEDNADNRLLIDAILGDSYALREYATGMEALLGMPEDIPALVLLDVSLPGLDGLDVLSRMRADPRLCDVPVIAVTAHAMSGDRERYLAAGFDGYVPKPIVDDRALVDLVRRLLADGRRD
jgi:two-component system, cell cycle response regulator DivK